MNIRYHLCMLQKALFAPDVHAELARTAHGGTDLVPSSTGESTSDSRHVHRCLVGLGMNPNFGKPGANGFVAYRW